MRQHFPRHRIPINGANTMNTMKKYAWLSSQAMLCAPWSIKYPRNKSRLEILDWSLINMTDLVQYPTMTGPA